MIFKDSFHSSWWSNQPPLKNIICSSKWESFSNFGVKRTNTLWETSIAMELSPSWIGNTSSIRVHFPAMLVDPGVYLKTTSHFVAILSLESPIPLPWPHGVLSEYAWRDPQWWNREGVRTSFPKKKQNPLGFKLKLGMDLFWIGSYQNTGIIVKFKKWDPLHKHIGIDDLPTLKSSVGRQAPKV